MCVCVCVCVVVLHNAVSICRHTKDTHYVCPVIRPALLTCTELTSTEPSFVN